MCRKCRCCIIGKAIRFRYMAPRSRTLPRMEISRRKEIDIEIAIEQIMALQNARRRENMWKKNKQKHMLLSNGKTEPTNGRERVRARQACGWAIEKQQTMFNVNIALKRYTDSCIHNWIPLKRWVCVCVCVWVCLSLSPAIQRHTRFQITSDFLFPIRLLNNKWDDAFKSAWNDKYLLPFAIEFVEIWHFYLLSNFLHTHLSLPIVSTLQSSLFSTLPWLAEFVRFAFVLPATIAIFSPNSIQRDTRTPKKKLTRE